MSVITTATVKKNSIEVIIEEPIVIHESKKVRFDEMQPRANNGTNTGTTAGTNTGTTAGTNTGTTAGTNTGTTAGTNTGTTAEINANIFAINSYHCKVAFLIFVALLAIICVLDTVFSKGYINCKSDGCRNSYIALIVVVNVIFVVIGIPGLYMTGMMWIPYVWQFVKKTTPQ